MMLMMLMFVSTASQDLEMSEIAMETKIQLFDPMCTAKNDLKINGES